MTSPNNHTVTHLLSLFFMSCIHFCSHPRASLLTNFLHSCSNYSWGSHFDHKVHWLNNQSTQNPLASTGINYLCLPVHMIKEVKHSQIVSIGLFSSCLPLPSCSITGVVKENGIVSYLKPAKNLIDSYQLIICGTDSARACFTLREIKNCLASLFLI